MRKSAAVNAAFLLSGMLLGAGCVSQPPGGALQEWQHIPLAPVGLADVTDSPAGVTKLLWQSISGLASERQASGEKGAGLYRMTSMDCLGNLRDEAKPAVVIASFTEPVTHYVQENVQAAALVIRNTAVLLSAAPPHDGPSAAQLWRCGSSARYCVLLQLRGPTFSGYSGIGIDLYAVDADSLAVERLVALGADPLPNEESVRVQATTEKGSLILDVTYPEGYPRDGPPMTVDESSRRAKVAWLASHKVRLTISAALNAD